MLDLGKVNCTAEVYVDGESVGCVTMPPYRVEFSGCKKPRRLEIKVANTAANECAVTDYFNTSDPRDVGPYHEKMHPHEIRTECGGLFGPVTLFKLD